MQRSTDPTPARRPGGSFLAGALTAALAAAAVPLASSVPAPSPAPQFDEGSVIGISFYVPKHVGADRLIDYALSTMKVQTISTNDERKRLVPMEGAIGIQGTDEERQRYAQELDRLDKQLGDLAREIEAARPKRVARRVDLRALQPETAVELVDRLGNDVSSLIVEETGALVLQGLAGDIEGVTTVLAEVDVPRPQMRLYCELIEAYDPEAGVDDPERLTGDFADAMEAIHPGKAFRRRGEAMVRSSVGGRRDVSLSSTFPALGSGGSDLVLQLDARPTGWDAATNVLTLDSCTVEVTDLTSGSQRLSTALALEQGETTVIGSLGGSPIYISLRFTMQ